MFFETNMIKSEFIESFEDQSKLMSQWLNDLETSPSSSCSLPSSPFNLNSELFQSSYTDNQLQIQYHYDTQFQENVYQYENFPTQLDYGNQYYCSNYYPNYNRNESSCVYQGSSQTFDSSAQLRNSLELDSSNISVSFSCSLTETDEDDLIELADDRKKFAIPTNRAQPRQSRKQICNQMDDNVNLESNGKRKRKRILNRLQRAEATMREKRRMLKLNKAFEELRKVLPISEFAKNKLSRSETLKSAIEYIDRMSQLLSI